MVEVSTSKPIYREFDTPDLMQSGTFDPFGADTSERDLSIEKSRSDGLAEVNSVFEVRLDALSLAGSPRILGENIDHVRALIEADIPLPPILVHKGTMQVIDGVHRVRAASLQGAESIRAQFFEGTVQEAFVLSVRANKYHGLPLSLSDKRAAADRILREFPEWSDRAIATIVGLAHRTVGRIRQCSAGENIQSNARVGRDGRTHTRNAAEGRRRVSELIEQLPEATVRELAKTAGVSIGTAQDVRQRLRRGEEPVPCRRSNAAKEVKSKTKSAAFEARNERRDPASLIQGLKNDPSLRFTEPGRELLRRLAIHPTSEKEWNALAVGVPGYRTKMVAELAGVIAQDWLRFAERLDQD